MTADYYRAPLTDADAPRGPFSDEQLRAICTRGTRETISRNIGCRKRG